jgi:hypothetical protein
MIIIIQKGNIDFNSMLKTKNIQTVYGGSTEFAEKKHVCSYPYSEFQV